MNILLLCDDYWHPGKIPVRGVKPLEEKGFMFDIIYDAAGFDPATLNGYPAIMLCKSNETSQTVKDPWITAEVEKAFTGYVENGGGLLVIHSGTVINKENEALARLIGCRFASHPNACPVTVAPVFPHPVTQGVEIFCETDEHYRIDILASDAAVVMASYSPPQGSEGKYDEDPYHNTSAWLGAAALVRTQGKGRVCTLTPGHTPEVWANAQFQKVLENALNWCAKV